MAHGAVARALASGFFVAGLVAWARDAAAYRPFDGTDADVAEVGAFELELGPVHYFREQRTSYLITPGATLNLGIANDLEFVVDFKDLVGLEKVPDQARVRLLETDVLFKWIIRRGTLQEQRGPSIAVELGPLLPEIGGEKYFGAQANFIVSYRTTFGAAHINLQAADSRRQNLDLFGGVIVEGPADWPARPVAEVFYDRELGRDMSTSALVGAIIPVRKSLTLDLGFRRAWTDGIGAEEVRLGFTWAISLWVPEGEAKVSAVPRWLASRRPSVQAAMARTAPSDGF